MVIALLVALLFLQIASWIYFKNKLNVLVCRDSELKAAIIELSNEIKTVITTNNNAEISVKLLEKTEEERKKAVLLTHSLGKQIAEIKTSFNEQVQSLSVEYDNKAHQFSRTIEYRENEIHHLKSIITNFHSLPKTQLQKNAQIKQEHNKTTTSASSNYDLSDDAETYNGERDGLSFQDEAASDYEGGTWGDNEYSEMGHDGDDY